MGKGDVAHEQRKVQDVAKAKGKNKICVDEISVVGLQKGRKKGDESEVTSPLKPKQDTREEDVMGYMDVGLSEGKKSTARGSWKKLARAQGLTEKGNTATQKEEEVGTKRPRKIEKQNAEEVRKNKKKREEAPDSVALMTVETAVTASQHRREP